MDLSAALATFMDEAGDLLSQMEDLLLRAENGACSQEDLHALFRCAHTIKGSAGLFGLDAVVHFTHVVENVLDRLRENKLAFSPELTGLLLECQDHISGLIAAVAAGDTSSKEGGDALLNRLQAFLPASAVAVAASASTLPAIAAANASAGDITSSGGGPLGTDHWHLSLRFGADVLRNGMDPLAFVRYLGTLGRIVHLETIAEALPPYRQFDPESCYLGFEIALHSLASKEELENVFEFVRDDAEIRILPPHAKAAEFIALIGALPEDSALLGEILIACGTLTRHELETALCAQISTAQQPRLGEILLQGGMVQSPVLDAALKKQKHNEEKRAVEAKSIKVPTERLDSLIDLVGELVIAGSSSQLLARQSRQAALIEANSHLLQLLEHFRDSALKLRMVPIGEVFSRFPRVVRDVSQEIGKEIELQINGADTELDKTMIEKIGDPLMHLLRNAIDHGIESSPARLAKGKPAKGTVRLSAHHESGCIVIEVADDGGGLDGERILKKAIEKGLVAADAKLSRSEIFHLILEPGFSTAEKITNLSGRGVGMDVVKNNVEALRGSIEIHSESGCGTTMRICLPLTLAIIDGFQISVGPSTFIVPLDQVLECIELPNAGHEHTYLDLRGEVLPFVHLRKLFDMPGAPPTSQKVVVVHSAGRKAGIVVNHLHGECLAVIKPLGQVFGRIAGISGSTILGSGEVALILDVPQLIEQAITRESRHLRPAATAKQFN